jgi:hypothetical protein
MWNVENPNMPGVPDTLIEIRTDTAQDRELAQVEREVCALYPPEAVKPKFQLAEVIERDGKRFVRLSTMAGSLHLLIRCGVKLKSFPRTVLAARDREVGNYECIS